MSSLPLDHPTAGRPHRVYVALTNHCNRSCPWCSTCSSPAGTTWMSDEAFRAALPADGAFQVQLEGGEPTLHPRFWELVAIARAEPRCDRLVLCTNGVVLPRAAVRLRAFVERLGAPLTLKLSVNHHLLDRDPGLLALSTLLAQTFDALDAHEALSLVRRPRRVHNTTASVNTMAIGGAIQTLKSTQSASLRFSATQMLTTPSAT